MRPAGGRLPLDPATHHTSKAIFGATRGASSASGASIPTTLLFLVALGVLLPALSFISLHTKVLSSQKILSDHYAVCPPREPARAAPLISPSPRPARLKSNLLVVSPRDARLIPSTRPIERAASSPDDDGGAHRSA